MNKRILTLFLSLTLLLSLAACGSKDTNATDARREANEIVVGIAQDLENSLDPYTSVTAANREVLFNVFAPPFRNILFVFKIGSLPRMISWTAASGRMDWTVGTFGLNRSRKPTGRHLLQNNLEWNIMRPGVLLCS